MTAPTITALPSAPDRGTPGTTFSATAATFVAALPDLVTEINALGTWLNSNALLSYSWGDGTAAAPSIHPASETSTGLFFETGKIGFSVTGTREMTLTGTGLGVGIASPDGTLHVHTASAGTVAASASADDLVVENSASGGISILTPSTGLGSVFFGDPDQPTQGRLVYQHTTDLMVLYASNTAIATVGSAGVRPSADNTIPLGSGGNRWSEVFAGTGTINTSDARTKTDIQDLDAAEQAVAVAAKGLLKKYRFKDAKDAKGDKARWHFGVVAQELAAAFEAEGLDPWAYGLLCHDFWVEADVTIPAEYKSVMVTPAELDEEGNEIAPAVYDLVEETPERVEHQTFATLADVPEGAANVVEHDRMGVRYDELFAFILAAI